MYERMNLQLFAEGTAAPGGEAGSATTAPEGGAAVPNTAPVFQSKRRGAKADPFANVVFGKQGLPSDGQNKEGQAPSEAAAEPGKGEKSVDRNAAFEGLITGEYKDLYEQKLSEARKQGADSMKGEADRYKQISSMMETLAYRYGISPDGDGNYDLSKISAAVESEHRSSLRERAMESGTTEAELLEAEQRERRYMQMQRENAAFRKAEAERRNKEAAMKIYAGWESQAEAARKIYPKLDLKEELKNPAFEQLMKAGVNVQTAYEVVHKDNLIHAAMQYAVDKTEKATAGKIAAQASRPVENGNGGSPVQVKTDPSKMTKAERREVCRRVARGERIVF